MVDIRNIICFITVLVGCCFLIQTVNAHIHIQTVPYRPDIIYLGRANHFELGSYPSQQDDPTSQYIYAEVKDIYANITDAYLNYTINNNKIWPPIKMTLINGIPANGTWRAEVPPSQVKIPYNVHYTVYFKDHLNYSIMKSGPYYNQLDYRGNDENLKGQQGYQVRSHYVKFEPVPRNANTISITAHVWNVDVGNGTANMQINLFGPIKSTYLTTPYTEIDNAKGNDKNINL
ncbi:MAG: hypothetical protein WAM14_23820, partial [Candidatus Nitrosopolaris sp.]